MSRPELTGHASLFYNERESKKYDSSSRMVSIQREITHRAIELLKLDSNSTTENNGGGRPSLILDVGCGSGLSGQVRTNTPIHPFTFIYIYIYVCAFFTALASSLHVSDDGGRF
jgi:18S rRNA (guanine1575-N7)-methyltransferase